jgi:hypothetical protein
MKKDFHAKHAEQSTTTNSLLLMLLRLTSGQWRRLTWLPRAAIIDCATRIAVVLLSKAVLQLPKRQT